MERGGDSGIDVLYVSLLSIRLTLGMVNRLVSWTCALFEFVYYGTTTATWYQLVAIVYVVPYLPLFSPKA